MTNPQIGQRWIVDTDPALGLGTVVEFDTRTMTLAFIAVDEQRCYAIKNAPLTRVIFTVDDLIETDMGSRHRVARVEHVNGLIVYIDDAGNPVPETQLAATIELHHPIKRLLAGQLDAPKWFDLRSELASGYQRWLQSDVIGLQGARITLTPHQLYVTQTATSRRQVRILLADEVGLGKTIEAGLILQRLLLQESVDRVLIIVPEALRIQWFVELLRCFNIHATLYDNQLNDASDSMGADIESLEPGNNLADARLFITSHDVLASTHQQVPLLAESWDMVIVDEAHHFDLATANSAGDGLRALAKTCEHLLLLSATPERMGLESHFLRLQLIDPTRFHSLDDFQQEFSSYELLADDLNTFLSADDASASLKHALVKHFPDSALDTSTIDDLSKDDFIELLLDCHGTGRVVFRNSRRTMEGFPRRHLMTHSLDGDDTDSKLKWLTSFIKQHSHEKTLFITHSKDDVLDIKEWLYRKTGIDCPTFHEDMTLVERDRAAAYFAEREGGAPVLLCSEIGSEGRNFQFCSHLICWDLPEHPDLLEQRIGRLDRIGQQGDINIHVCLDSNADTQQRLHWYHDVLNCIEKTNPVAGALHDQWYLQYKESPQRVATQVHEQTLQLLEQLENGRDRLLEINSCRQPEADQLVATVNQVAAENSPEQVLSMAADLLNLHYEPLDDTRFSVIPSDQMLVPVIPGVPADGCEITFERTTATAREDVQFVTWDHPLMQGLNELITTSELGVSTIALLPNKALKPGMLFLEALFSVAIKAPNAQQAARFLSQPMLRIVVAEDNPKNLNSVLPRESLTGLLENAPKSLRKALVKDYRDQIDGLASSAEALALTEMDSVIDASIAQLQQRAKVELARLQQLQQRNNLIKQDDIVYQQRQFDDIADALQHKCKPQMTAVRLLVTYKPERGY